MKKLNNINFFINHDVCIKEFNKEDQNEYIKPKSIVCINKHINLKTFKPLFYYNEVYLDNCNIILGSQEITNNQQKVLLWAPVEFPANKLILREMGQRLSFIPKQFKNY